MNCDDFPALYESDDSIERRLAEQHAAGCSHCRETLRIISLVREELSISTATEERRVDSRTVPATSHRRSDRFAVVAMAACLAVVAAFVVVDDSDHRDRDTVDAPPTRPIGRIVQVAEDDSLRQIDALDEELDLLSQRLDRIALHAALLDERRDLAQLTEQSR